jgi:hypothetical protein
MLKRIFQIKLFFIQTFPAAAVEDDDEDTPISYTVKLKDSDESITPTMKKQKNIVKVMKHQVIQKNHRQHHQ